MKCNKLNGFNLNKCISIETNTMITIHGKIMHPRAAFLVNKKGRDICLVNKRDRRVSDHAIGKHIEHQHLATIMLSPGPIPCFLARGKPQRVHKWQYKIKWHCTAYYIYWTSI